MNFIEAIKVCYFKKYWTTNGRSTRSEFWYFLLFYVGVLFFLNFIAPIVQDLTPQQQFSSKKDWSNFVYISLFVFSFFSFLPVVSVMTRRLHDINQPGYWVLVSVVINIVGMTTGQGMIGILALIIFGMILILCIKDGDKKDNEFGKNIYKKKK
jgi:uncharacterized membrane protein YhaH (DUF805 family)